LEQWRQRLLGHTDIMDPDSECNITDTLSIVAIGDITAEAGTGWCQQSSAAQLFMKYLKINQHNHSRLS
jgi:hypothetical protein